MKKHFYCFLLIAISFATSCSPNQNGLQKEISALESRITVTNISDTAACDSLIKLYKNYCTVFKDDTCCADYFFKAAEVSTSLGKYQQAIELYGSTQRFPVYRKGARALFLQGFIAENNLHDKNAAREYYNRFIIKFPNHSMTPDVLILLQSLNMTDEMLIKELQNNQDTIQSGGC